ncbi:unnamed protein product [Notodromas monacha]|uniref:Transcription termination factor 3, mitochondrial n=1 Tax=Notodromas monacha TaxID=399045 RepID=A0A7R9BFZ6_9CRUS|nr:unnamed protein product [Notodromas monacha]CAG0914756.1 unnamed protein product [Notodromas monacha]
MRAKIMYASYVCLRRIARLQVSARQCATFTDFFPDSIGGSKDCAENIADILQMDLAKTESILESHPFLMKDLDELQNNVEFLEKRGLRRGTVAQTPGILNFSTRSLIERTHLVEEASDYQLSEAFPLMKDLDELQNNVEFLEKRGLRRGTVAQTPGILNFSTRSLIERTHLVEEASDYQLSEAFPFCTTKTLSEMDVRRSTDSVVLGHRSRPKYFAAKLDLEPSSACSLFVKFPFLHLVLPIKLSEVIELLLSNGIAKQDLTEDLWILRHNKSVMAKRLKIARKYEVTVKPWHLRCPEKRFNASMEVNQANHVARGDCANNVQFLATALSCSEEDIRDYFRRFNPLKTVSTIKLKTGLDVLLKAGFSKAQILNGLRVLAYDPQRIALRLTTLKKKNLEGTHEVIFCASRPPRDLITRVLRSSKGINPPVRYASAMHTSTICTDNS